LPSIHCRAKNSAISSGESGEERKGRGYLTCRKPQPLTRLDFVKSIDRICAVFARRPRGRISRCGETAPNRAKPRREGSSSFSRRSSLAATSIRRGIWRIESAQGHGSKASSGSLRAHAIHSRSIRDPRFGRFHGILSLSLSLSLSRICSRFGKSRALERRRIIQLAERPRMLSKIYKPHRLRRYLFQESHVSPVLLSADVKNKANPFQPHSTNFSFRPKQRETARSILDDGIQPSCVETTAFGGELKTGYGMRSIKRRLIKSRVIKAA